MTCCQAKTFYVLQRLGKLTKWALKIFSPQTDMIEPLDASHEAKIMAREVGVAFSIFFTMNLASYYKAKLLLVSDW